MIELTGFKGSSIALLSWLNKKAIYLPDLSASAEA